jgi:pilus assembly protein CpaC
MPTTSSEGQVSVEFKQYGIILKIEPIVDEDNNIMAHVETEVSEIDDSVVVSGIPGIKTRSTQTDISMRERQTLVIAGLLKEEGSNNNDGVAWLKNLPVLGPLFRSNNFKNNKTELVIFVTPTIHDVNSPENKAALNKANSIQSQFSKIVKGNGILE